MGDSNGCGQTGAFSKWTKCIWNVSNDMSCSIPSCDPSIVLQYNYKANYQTPQRHFSALQVWMLHCKKKKKEIWIKVFQWLLDFWSSRYRCWKFKNPAKVPPPKDIPQWPSYWTQDPCHTGMRPVEQCACHSIPIVLAKDTTPGFLLLVEELWT